MLNTEHAAIPDTMDFDSSIAISKQLFGELTEDHIQGYLDLVLKSCLTGGSPEFETSFKRAILHNVIEHLRTLVIAVYTDDLSKMKEFRVEFQEDQITGYLNLALTGGTPEFQTPDKRRTTFEIIHRISVFIIAVYSLPQDDLTQNNISKTINPDTDENPESISHIY